jgi:hypothetical protein
MAGIGGTSGNDSLTGTAGSDSVYGGAGGGADTVTGGSGGDRLAGGTGDDSLSGGGGDDTFVLADGSGDDVVSDFELGALASPRDLFDVSNLCDADGNPVNWRDVTVSDDGLGNAILSFPGARACSCSASGRTRSTTGTSCAPPASPASPPVRSSAPRKARWRSRRSRRAISS